MKSKFWETKRPLKVKTQIKAGNICRDLAAKIDEKNDEWRKFRDTDPYAASTALKRSQYLSTLWLDECS